MLEAIIITFAFALATLLIVVILVPSLSKKNKKLEKELADLRNAIKGLEVAEKEMEKVSFGGSLPGVTYDAAKKHYILDGNLSATGWVSSGGIKKEE